MTHFFPFRISSSVVTGSAIVAAIVITLPTPASAKTPQEIAQIALDKTVQVNNSLLPGGSGVLIGKQGNTYLVLTANHVVKRPDLSYTVRTRLGKEYTAQIQPLQTDQNGPDLAVITFESADNYSTATIGDSDQSAIGSAVFVVGYPALGELTGAQREIEFTQGIVTSRPASRPQGYTLRYNAVTRGGMSGGPVFDANGRVVGIHGQGDVEGSFQSESGSSVAVKTGFNSAIPINTFLALRSKLNVSNPQVVQDRSPSQEKPVQINAPQTVKDYYVRGLTLQDQGDRQGAAAAFDKALQLNPNDAAIYYQRGVSLHERGQKQAAIADYDQAIRLNGNYGDAYYQRAMARYDLADKQGALADFTAAIRLSPNDVYAHYNRGVIRRSLKDSQGTLEDFDQVVRLAPSSRAYYNRALARSMVRDKQGTISDFGEAIRLDPNFTAAYINRALVRRREGDREGAIDDLTQALRIEPNNATAFYNRGLFRRDLGDRAGAFEDLQKALALFQQKSETQSYQKAAEVLERLQRDGGSVNTVPNSSTPTSSTEPVF